ncbi:MAG TPA: nitrite/sulfite reductase, partial [Solirubrobacterales bacterium]|nr:nitrite/sulfite reductase [Solirubrobacterales bacterium]
MEPTAVDAASAAERIAAEHKLEVDPAKGRKGKGPVGSLENPEVYDDVPGQVIPILEREFEDFETETTKFLDRSLDEDAYIPFRLKQGVYGQRQPDVQMVRVKLPLGGVNPEQMERFADVVERYAPLGKGHITTRENIQMHHIPTGQVPDALRELGEVGLSSREGCGNTMRNVTGDPFAGVCADEPFDITPYATAYVRYFVRHPTTQAMPRKFKTAFTASDADRAMTGIHDLGFVPKVRDGVRGVEMVVGGGTSIMPRIAQRLYDFVELDNGDYLR